MLEPDLLFFPYLFILRKVFVSNLPVTVADSQIFWFSKQAVVEKDFALFSVLKFVSSISQIMLPVDLSFLSFDQEYCLDPEHLNWVWGCDQTAHQ